MRKFGAADIWGYARLSAPRVKQETQNIEKIRHAGKLPEYEFAIRKWGDSSLIVQGDFIGTLEDYYMPTHNHKKTLCVLLLVLMQGT